MEELPFVWNYELNKKLLQLRYEHDWLFKKKKQPWADFYKILLENDFPQNMSISSMRKRYSYMYETYKLAKKTRNKGWKYYKFFEKIYGKVNVLDKYADWTDEWRLKLITCIHEAKAMGVDINDMWRTIETAMRSQDLPVNCCIQDIKGLWHHVRMTFSRKHRMKLKKGLECEWPLYDAMLEYYKRFDPKYMDDLETVTATDVIKRERKLKVNSRIRQTDRQEDEEGDDFYWTKDITESFIQIRLQNDWMFTRRKWAWNAFRLKMIEEYGFPKTLTSRELSRKWASTYSDFQKAKATNNKSWVYYNLFELYLGEGNLSLNPIINWQEEWVQHLISARTDLEPLFRFAYKNETNAWREVEKRLRSVGLPLDHSLLDLPEIWSFLLRTFRWKRKFARKGMLQEQWPYYEALLQYQEAKGRAPVKKQKQEEIYDNGDLPDDDYEDDMKLFDLKQKMQLDLKPKYEFLDGTQCRSCSVEVGCVNIFNQVDGDGLNLAHKLKIICGVEVETSDNLPSLICLNCLQQLETAYKFRRKCQEVDKDYRSRIAIKTERAETHIQAEDNTLNVDVNNPKDDPHITDIEDFDSHYDTDYINEPEKKVRKKVVIKKDTRIKRKKKKVRKDRYVYWKVCEVCGKHTRNLKSHLDAHSTGKGYSCEICDKKFKFKSGLIIHKAVHNPTPKKTCEICGKTFHIMAQYRRHFVYHANERKYECDTCGKRFNTVDILKVHVRIHTDERPFACPECGKTFRTAGCVSRHKRIVHRTAKARGSDPGHL